MEAAESQWDGFTEEMLDNATLQTLDYWASIIKNELAKRRQESTPINQKGGKRI